jgi:epoxide hydrolase 4
MSSEPELTFVDVAPQVRLAAWRSGGDTRHTGATGPSGATRPTAPRVMFLHGFPEGAFVWHDLMRALAQDAHCLAPSLRGYAPSSMPLDAAAYKPRLLVADLLALIDHFAGAGQALDLLVAHDWGGALAWNLAASHPGRLKQLLIINAPHPATFLRELRNNSEQQTASQYMWQLVDAAAETLLAANDHAALWPFFGDAAWLTPPLRQLYRAQWAAGLTGALNYYRASPLRPPQPGATALAALDLPRELTHVSVPTTVLWGEADHALRPSLLDGLQEHVPRLQVLRLPQASHWLLHEEPALVLTTIRGLLDGMRCPAPVQPGS